MTAYPRGLAMRSSAASTSPNADPIHKATIIPARPRAGHGDAPAGSRQDTPICKEKMVRRSRHRHGRARGGGDYHSAHDKVSSGASSDIKIRDLDMARRDGDRMGHEREPGHDRLWR